MTNAHVKNAGYDVSTIMPLDVGTYYSDGRRKFQFTYVNTELRCSFIRIRTVSSIKCLHGHQKVACSRRSTISARQRNFCFTAADIALQDAVSTSIYGK